VQEAEDVYRASHPGHERGISGADVNRHGGSGKAQTAPATRIPPRDTKGGDMRDRILKVEFTFLLAAHIAGLGWAILAVIKP
jgi:hypothetical protein